MHFYHRKIDLKIMLKITDNSVHRQIHNSVKTFAKNNVVKMQTENQCGQIKIQICSLQAGLKQEFPATLYSTLALHADAIDRSVWHS